MCAYVFDDLSCWSSAYDASHFIAAYESSMSLDVMSRHAYLKVSLRLIVAQMHSQTGFASNCA